MDESWAGGVTSEIARSRDAESSGMGSSVDLTLDSTF